MLGGKHLQAAAGRLWRIGSSLLLRGLLVHHDAVIVPPRIRASARLALERRVVSRALRRLRRFPRKRA